MLPADRTPGWFDGDGARDVVSATVGADDIRQALVLTRFEVQGVRAVDTGQNPWATDRVAMTVVQDEPHDAVVFFPWRS